jgi:hypothetical protein
MEKVTIDNVPYCFSRLDEGAAGSDYANHYYLTVNNNQCFTTHLVIQYTNCYMFGGPTDEAYKKCDEGQKAIETKMLDQVVPTFKFLE